MKVHVLESSEKSETLRVAIAGVLLGSNIALMIFLFSEANFLASNSFIHDYVYNWIRWGLLIDTLLLYLYLASVGVLSVQDQKFTRFGWARPAGAWYRVFYRWGVEFAFYLFTFSLSAYLGSLIVQ